MTKATAVIHPRFLTLDEIHTIHEMSLYRYGGAEGILNQGLLESALAQPEQAFGGQYAHEFPFGMAAAYGFHLAKNHAFRDGNKRVAFGAMFTFLRLNNWHLTANQDLAGDTMLGVAAGTINKEQLSQWTEQWSRAMLALELREFLRNLNYAQLASMFRSVSNERTPESRAASMIEAMEVIPCVTQAAVGAMEAEMGGDHASAAVLRQHAILLTAIYRLAEDKGYEW